MFFSSRTVMKLWFHSTLRACFSSGLHRPASAPNSPHGCPQCIVVTVKTHCRTAVTSVGSRCLTHKSLLVLSCSGSGAHFYWAQNGLRMAYVLTINYGVRSANGSLT